MSDLEYLKERLIKYILYKGPCIFCGYFGPNYWQTGSHKDNCIFYNIGGGVDREAYLAEKFDENKLLELIKKLYEI